GDVGLNVRIDNSGYQAIQKYTSGDKERLNQLYYKLVSVGSRQEKREVNGVTIQIAIDDLRRMDEFMDHMPARIEHNDKADVDQLTIEQLASSLEQKVAEEIEFAVEEVRRKGAPNSAEDGGPNGTDHFAAPADRIETIVVPAPAAATAETAGKPRILIVDDSPTIRAAVTKALENDFELVQATDGEKGWVALCADSSIKLVVTDLMMPGMDGFALIERIRSAKVPGIAGLPIIVVTALEDPQAKVHALVAGANDFITKRTDTLELQARVVARYQLSQIVGNGEIANGARPSKEPGPPPQEIAAALLGTRNSTTFGRRSVNIAGAAKRYGRINRDSSNATASDAEPLNADAAARSDTEQAGNQTWVRALRLDRLARMSSTTGITLLASVVVVAVILGILFVNRSPSEVATAVARDHLDPAAANLTPPTRADGAPPVSEEQQGASTDSTESWTTADGSPAREKLPALLNETTGSASTAVKAAPVPAKQDVPLKNEAKPEVTVAQALPKAANESAAPVVKADAARTAVDAPTASVTKAEKQQTVPTDAASKATPTPA
ncbi:MAG TPA: response regulator, partial [Burkholderiales bacterium]|nr:response regulator [Burkholderiales bacterium]